MSKEKGPWRDGRRAWERLAFWYPDGRPVRDDPERDPLTALADVGLVRRLLDETELEAVRSARRRGLSWAEIATKLGVSRQSAWERWRDLDTSEPTPAPAPEPAGRSEFLDRAARAARRQRFVRVPHVVGKTVEEAHHMLDDHGLLAVSADPDGPPPAVLELGQLVVSGQNPDHGAKVPVGTAVKLWTERGGGSGVREPRRPRPTPLAERELPDEALGSQQAVG
ncbi:PASTA domain-containing protein [Pseudonocardia sp. N23]|uniref:PASTA domain-containing protein n=1 Tax=Pseudonocardia sp. N23 TaxID=1987376 RepID=UPI000BFD1992|nr:PASTA domain-containing protein [Pseudonocardia sp. N23]GAY08824.1 hypothetical protein TOK_2780 [Pseudonocardia sp. N23]